MGGIPDGSRYRDEERSYRVTNSSLSSTANPQQLEAITTTEGPLLIIAGPGSGKTFTLVERIVYLLTEVVTETQ